MYPRICHRALAADRFYRTEDVELCMLRNGWLETNGTAIGTKLVHRSRWWIIPTAASAVWFLLIIIITQIQRTWQATPPLPPFPVPFGISYLCPLFSETDGIKLLRGSSRNSQDHHKSDHSPDSLFAYAGLNEHERGVHSALHPLHPVINRGSNCGDHLNCDREGRAVECLFQNSSDFLNAIISLLRMGFVCLMNKSDIYVLLHHDND